MYVYIYIVFFVKKKASFPMKLGQDVPRDTEPPEHQSCCCALDDVETEETPPLAFIFHHLVVVTSPAARA